jgi:hypothetical protein
MQTVRDGDDSGDAALLPGSLAFALLVDPRDMMRSLDFRQRVLSREPRDGQRLASPTSRNRDLHYSTTAPPIGFLAAAAPNTTPYAALRKTRLTKCCTELQVKTVSINAQSIVRGGRRVP